MAGLCRGDVYALVDLTAAPSDESAVIARATVQSVELFDAYAAVVGDVSPSDYLVAYPRSQALPPCIVQCDGLPELRARLDDVPWLRRPEPRDAPHARIELRGDVLAILDDAGLLATTPAPPNGIGDVIELLAGIASARALRALEGAHGLPPDCVEVALSRPGSGAYDDDDLLIPGQRIEIQIDNRTAAQLFAHAFTVAPHGMIIRLTADATLGVPLGPREHVVLGGSDVGPRGIEVRWPDSLPWQAPRRVDVVVIIVSAAVDLGVLERRGGAQCRLTRRSGAATRDIAAPSTLLSLVPTDSSAYVVRLGYRVTSPESGR
jgi:hypothetical protein